METLIQFPSYVIIPEWGLPQFGLITPTHWLMAGHRDHPNDTDLMSLIVLTDSDLAQKTWNEEDPKGILLPVRNENELYMIVEGLYRLGIKLVEIEPGEKFAHPIPSLDVLRQLGWDSDLLDQSPES